MRILHVASFVGNVGDNASHQGLYSILSGLFDAYEVEQLEIRKFYKNYQHSDKRYFNHDFIIFANQFDLVVIGGGGFLDYWVKDSSTGTTVDLAPELVKEIKVPTIIASVGCVPHKDVPDGNIEKFRSFLEAVKLNPKVKILIRNDGSVNSFKKYIGKKYLDDISEILDNGFFFDVNETLLPFEDEYVAINITNDQLAMNSSCRESIRIDRYHDALVKTIKYLCEEKKLKIVFVPHIYSDLKAISEIVFQLDDYIIREFVSIAPCIQGDSGARLAFSVYKHSALTIGSRFHANVCALAMRVPVVGLVALDRVKYVFDQFKLPDSYVLLDYDFSDDLIKIIDTKLHETDGASESLALDLDVRKGLTRTIYSDVFRAFGFKVLR